MIQATATACEKGGQWQRALLTLVSFKLVVGFGGLRKGYGDAEILRESRCFLRIVWRSFCKTPVSQTVYDGIPIVRMWEATLGFLKYVDLAVEGIWFIWEVRWGIGLQLFPYSKHAGKVASCTEHLHVSC